MKYDCVSDTFWVRNRMEASGTLYESPCAIINDKSVETGKNFLMDSFLSEAIFKKRRKNDELSGD